MQIEKINIKIKTFFKVRILSILITLKKRKGIKKNKIIENVIRISLNKLLKIILSFSPIPAAADFIKKFISRMNM